MIKLATKIDPVSPSEPSEVQEAVSDLSTHPSTASTFDLRITMIGLHQVCHRGYLISQISLQRGKADLAGIGRLMRRT